MARLGKPVGIANRKHEKGQNMNVRKFDRELLPSCGKQERLICLCGCCAAITWKHQGMKAVRKSCLRLGAPASAALKFSLFPSQPETPGLREANTLGTCRRPAFPLKLPVWSAMRAQVFVQWETLKLVWMEGAGESTAANVPRQRISATSFALL